MNFPPKVLQWAPVVQQETQRGGYPFPSEFTLSVILAESGGDVGQVNPNSGASGLMQVMPNTLASYNKNNNPDISLDTLRSHNISAGPEQIRVGMWVMGRYLKKSFNWLSETNPGPAISDLMRIECLMYLGGPGLVYSKFGHMTDRRFDTLVSAYPNWKYWKYPRKIWKWTTVNNDPTWDTGAIDSWVSGTTEPPVLPPPMIAGQNGFLGAMLIIALASWYLSKRNS